MKLPAWEAVSVRSGELITKLLALVAVPPGVVTAIVPVVALVGTVVVICVFESTVKVVFEPLNFTTDVPLKFVPVITTFVFTLPFVGVKLVMLGAGGLVRLSILARKAEAIVPGNAEKNVKPVSSSIECADVT